MGMEGNYYLPGESPAERKFDAKIAHYSAGDDLDKAQFWSYAEPKRWNAINKELNIHDSVIAMENIFGEGYIGMNYYV